MSSQHLTCSRQRSERSQFGESGRHFHQEVTLIDYNPGLYFRADFKRLKQTNLRSFKTVQETNFRFLHNFTFASIIL